MRSNKGYIIEVFKVKGIGEIPPFIPLIHRHFVKAVPPVVNKTEAHLTASVDLLDLIVPSEILDNIEEIEITYRKGGSTP